MKNCVYIRPKGVHINYERVDVYNLNLKNAN
jgi:hypothetical protein